MRNKEDKEMKKLFVLNLVLMIIAFSNVCLAGSWISGAKEGVAIGGYDTVAYFTTQKAIMGSVKNNYEWGGTVWFFASPENRDLFIADPEKYVPQYGGHCALSVYNGKNAKGDGAVWTIYKKKLYLNFNRDVQDRWLKNMSEYIYYADREWPKIKARLEE
ncbi:MAG: YHS domain protein [Deltaproteobacteria bacterium]|nr:YHS domain protein [Deltaproteobacteria bacterium]